MFESLFNRPFDVLMWLIVGAILVTLLVSGGKNTVSLFQTAADSFLKALKLITGQPVNSI